MLTFNQFGMLLEYDRSKAAQALGKRFKDAVDKDRTVKGKSIEDVLAKLETADPTPNRQYMQWLINAFQNGSKIEDLLSRGKQNLIKFVALTKHKKLKPEDRDIGKLSDVKDLENKMDQYEDGLEKPKVVNKGSSTELVNNSEMRVIQPKDENAAIYYGQGTKWCTAADENNMFKTYSEDGPLYILIPKHPKHPGEKYQWHFKTDQYMDETDSQVDLEEFRRRFPQTSYFMFKYYLDTNTHDHGWEYDKPEWLKIDSREFYLKYWKDGLADGSLPTHEAMNYAWYLKNKRMTIDPRIKEILLKSKDGWLLATFATNITVEPWPEAEQYIKKDYQARSLYTNNLAAKFPDEILHRFMGIEKDEK